MFLITLYLMAIIINYARFYDKFVRKKNYSSFKIAQQIVFNVC